MISHPYKSEGWGLKKFMACRIVRAARSTRAWVVLALAFSALLSGVLPAGAQDQLTLAVGQRGNWDTSIAELGQRSGIFAKHGLELEILYTQGGGETLQTVISSAVDVGVGPSAMAVLGAYGRGAPVRVIGAEATGATDLFW